MEILKFCRDWEQFTGPGSKLIKSQFMRKMFQREVHVRDRFAQNLSDEDEAQAMAEYADDFRTWKSRYHTITTGRNLLLKAYNVVRISRV
jgi:hypothetical protein